jgi:ribosomal protein S26
LDSVARRFQGLPDRYVEEVSMPVLFRYPQEFQIMQYCDCATHENVIKVRRLNSQTHENDIKVRRLNSQTHENDIKVKLTAMI